MKSYDDFFAALRGGLWGTPINEVSDWDKMLKIAEEQTVLGIVAEAIVRMPKDKQPQKEVMNMLLVHGVRNMNAHSLLNSRLAQLVNVYREHGIEGVLLKGQGIALCYPSATMRQCGDIDFYVGKEAYRRAVDIAKNTLALKADGSESYKHFEFQYKGVIIELHRYAAMPLRPWLSRRFNRWLTEQLDDPSKWRKAEIGGSTINLPPVMFDVVYIFYHAMFHLMAFEGVGLRQICDWAMVLHVHRDEIDRDELRKTLDDLSLLKLWQIFGYIAVNYLGLPGVEMPFYSDKVKRKAEKVLDYIMECGNFGHKRRNVSTATNDESLKGRWNAMRWHINCVTQLFSVAPVDVGGNLAHYVCTGPFRVISRRFCKK